VAFIGDGDAISICVAYLHKREIVDYGPTEIAVFDFDERICGAVTRFADREGLTQLRAHLYNCLEPFPSPGRFDCFYTNPPWGASNGGESVKIFVQRGMEATGYRGEGMVVIADDDELEWPKVVLSNVQQFAISSGFFVQKMMPQLHQYHLDDAPELRSCNLVFKALTDNPVPGASAPIRDEKRLANFYGRDNKPKVRYVRERKRLDYGKAHEDEYSFEWLEKEL
jgi:N4-bis(aminopropyl)spermidine synthase